MSLVADAPTEALVPMVQTERVKPHDVCERAMRGIEAFKQQIAALTRDDAPVRVHPLSDMSHPTLRVLVHLFATKNMGHRDVGVMTRKLNMERHAVQDHLDLLHARGLAESERGSHRLGHLYWGLTPQGRQYVADHNLA